MNRLNVLSFKAAGQISAKTAVMVSEGDGEDYCVEKADGAGVVIGVSGSESKKNGEHIDITTAGTVPIIAGGSIAVGDRVKADADGKAAAAASDEEYFGVALTNAAADEEVTIILKGV